jgi:hypothetical protein
LNAHRQIIALRVHQAVSAVGQAFEFASRTAQAFSKVLLPIAAIAAAVMFPLIGLSAALIFLAADFDRYLNGKDSVIGRLLYKLQTIGDEMKRKGGIFGFLGDVFREAHEAAKAFFDYVEGKIPKDPTAAAQQTAKAKGVGGAGIGAGIGLLTGGPVGALVGAGLGGAIGYLSGGGALAGKTMSQITGGPTFQINVAATPGTDGHQVGRDIVDELVTNQDIQRMLREAVPAQP